MKFVRDLYAKVATVGVASGADWGLAVEREASISNSGNLMPRDDF
jgi:hypothetical protein